MKKKYTIHQTSETGHVYNERGDNQHITINITDGWGDDDEEDDDDQDIIAPIGKNNKVFVNGRQVK